MQSAGTVNSPKSIAKTIYFCRLRSTVSRGLQWNTSILLNTTEKEISNNLIGPVAWNSPGIEPFSRRIIGDSPDWKSNLVELVVTIACPSFVNAYRYFCNVYYLLRRWMPVLKAFIIMCVHNIRNQRSVELKFQLNVFRKLQSLCTTLGDAHCS